MDKVENFLRETNLDLSLNWTCIYLFAPCLYNNHCSINLISKWFPSFFCDITVSTSPFMIENNSGLKNRLKQSSLSFNFVYQVIKFVQTLTIRWHWSQFNKTCCAHNDNWFKSSFLISWYTKKKTDLCFPDSVGSLHFFLLDNINLPKTYSNHLLPIRYLTSQKEKK